MALKLETRSSTSPEDCISTFFAKLVLGRRVTARVSSVIGLERNFEIKKVINIRQKSDIAKTILRN